MLTPGGRRQVFGRPRKAVCSFLVYFCAKQAKQVRNVMLAANQKNREISQISNERLYTFSGGESDVHSEFERAGNAHRLLQASVQYKN
jgi:hypothetical protein